MDISGNQTFSTVRPLLNIWAAFTPSNNVSMSLPIFHVFNLRFLEWNRDGHTASRVCKFTQIWTRCRWCITICSTAFGLYRVGTELRAIYCGKKPVARSACASLGTACDYPILLGQLLSIPTSSLWLWPRG
jgi:hypothetical protein